jgi:hypothetical protein
MKDIQRTTGLLLSLLIVACIGLVILRMPEGFLAPPGSKRCGIQLGDCPNPGTRCMNGYCGSTELPKMPKDSGLPVYP